MRADIRRARIEFGETIARFAEKFREDAKLAKVHVENSTEILSRSAFSRRRATRRTTSEERLCESRLLWMRSRRARSSCDFVGRLEMSESRVREVTK